MFDSKLFIKNLTSKPGVYQMLDEEGEVIYVGKARNLKKRVASYFLKSVASPKTVALVQQIRDINILITHTENEALLLENTLIKKHHPKYNVLFRDDKSYPYLYLSSQEDFPRLDFFRGKRGKKGHYFGPYPSSGSVRETLNLLQKLFRIRQCSESFFKSRTRPCLQYQIKRCTAPCVGYVDKETYQQDVQHAILFLEGKNEQVVNDLIKRMDKASHALEFELAAHFRDQIASLRKVQERQSVMGDQGDQDIIAVLEQNNLVCIEVIFMRSGRIIGDKTYFPKVPKNTSFDEVLSAFLPQFYLESVSGRGIPAQILLNHDISDKEWLMEVLSKEANHKVTISSRVKSERKRLLDMAQKNAQHALESHFNHQSNSYQRFVALQKVLNLANVPERLECFDISHTMGEATVASCVVFNREGPLKADYRRFNIKDITPGDDYAAMKQAIERRYTKLKEGEGKLPDVLIIDGGKGQLHQAEAVFEELQVSGVLLLAVAKGPSRKPGEEDLWLSGHKQALDLAGDSQALHLIQQIRDEAHRFAITGHRQQRGKARQTSPLEAIPGVGAQRRRELLRQLGGMQGVYRANVEDLARIPGISRALAQRIFDALHD